MFEVSRHHSSLSILVVTQYFWPENFVINSLVRDLVRRGHRVTVLTGMPNYPEGKLFQGYDMLRPRRQQFENAQVIRVPLIPRGSARGLRLALNYFSFAMSSCLLAPIYLRKLDIQVILVFQTSPVTVGLPALILRWQKHAPILFWVQDLWPESLSATGAIRSPMILAGVRRLVRFIYRFCDRVLVQSEAFRASVASLGVPSRKIIYFPNSADEFFRPTTVSADSTLWPLEPNGFTVMFAGNIGAAQDFETILSAAERLREHADIEWVIVGDGRERPWVEAELTRRRLVGTVTLLGKYPPASMPEFFALADCLLVTLRKEDIFALTVPSKVQAYLACARPIVAALEGEGARVIREAGAGMVSGAGDAKGLAESILAMSRLSPAERHEMGQRGRRYFESHFDAHRLIDRLEVLMADAVKEHR